MVFFCFEGVEFAVSIYSFGFEEEVFEAGVGCTYQGLLVVFVLDPDWLHPHFLGFLLPGQDGQPFLLVGLEVVGRPAFAQHHVDDVGLIFCNSDFGLLGGLEVGLVQVWDALVLGGLIVKALVHLVDGW